MKRYVKELSKPKLSMEMLHKIKNSKVVSSEEALKDVEPFDWGFDNIEEIKK